MKLSIIIPTYNEEKTITKIVEKVQKVNLGNIEKELIIVDDFSKDDSVKKIKDLVKYHKNIRLIRHSINRGKGASIVTGFKYVTGDIILIQDADLEYNPEEYKKLIKPILEGETKIVYGSRLIGKIKGFNVPLHYLGNKILSIFTTLLYFKKITDMETCYKVMTKDVVKSIKIKSKRFDFEPEITAKLLKKGYKIKEVPISYNCRSFEEGKKITWKDGIKALYVLLKYRFIE